MPSHQERRRTNPLPDDYQVPTNREFVSGFDEYSHFLHTNHGDLAKDAFAAVVEFDRRLFLKMHPFVYPFLDPLKR